MRLFLTVMALTLLALSSCKKAPVANTDCPPSRILIRPGSSSLVRTAFLHYGPDGVSEVSYSSGERFTLTYSNGIPVRRHYFSTGSNTHYRYDSFVYNGGRTPQRVLRYERNVGVFFLADSTEIELTNGSLTGLRNYQRTNINAPWRPNVLYRFTNSDGNITGYILDRYYSGVLGNSDTTTVRTDNEPNAYNRVHPEFYLYHPVWAYEGPEQLFFQMNANNITGLAQASAQPVYFPYSFEYDPLGRFVSAFAGGGPEITLQYDCP
ncbi:MAG: hypothetical protein EOP50_18060 [Sphingobacteriales bacterium]|nr:MAG: hypothetical protein EOP50_18060 [Sphingobacteriales bacterium]